MNAPVGLLLPSQLPKQKVELIHIQQSQLGRNGRCHWLLQRQSLNGPLQLHHSKVAGSLQRSQVGGMGKLSPKLGDPYNAGIICNMTGLTASTGKKAVHLSWVQYEQLANGFLDLPRQIGQHGMLIFGAAVSDDFLRKGQWRYQCESRHSLQPYYILRCWQLVQLSAD